MTWTERVGDLATNVTLVIVNFIRIFTLILSIAAEKLDGLVTALAERSEGGISRTTETGSGWLSLPASVAWGLAAILLRAASVITVFTRQATATADDFLRALVEEDQPEPPAPARYGSDT